jgi:polysaccharide pyruvyl transferase WcaK-like protein
VAVLIEEIRRRYPQAEIFGLTSNPVDTKQRHKIAAYPARNMPVSVNVAVHRSPTNNVDTKSDGDLNTVLHRIKDGIKNIPFLYSGLKLTQSICRQLVSLIGEIGFIVRSLQRVKGTDLLIVAGSGQLCDNFYGAWGFPYTLLKWAIIARLSRAKLAFASCGAGPIDSWLSRTFIKRALLLADYRSFRDQESKELIEKKVGVRGNQPVLPDLVFGAKLRSQDGFDESRIVAVNPFPHYDYRYWPVSEPDAYQSYIDRLASFTSWLIKHNFTALLFATQLRADPLVMEDVKSILMKDKNLDLDKHLLMKTIASVEELVEQLSGADAVVASRFHGVLLSFLLKKPVLALSHHPKVANLMRDMGQSDYILDIDKFDVPTAASRFGELYSKRDDIRRQIEANVTRNQKKLESQYTTIFGVSPTEPVHRVLAISQ